MEFSDGRRISRRTAIRFAGAALALPAMGSSKAVAQAQSNPTKSATSVEINVKSFGAQGDSVPDASRGTDDTAAIQAAINYVASLGGGTLYFPEGCYLITSYLSLCANLRVVGTGKRGSCIVTSMVGGGGSTRGQSIRNGTAFFSNWPSNGSNTANICIEHLGFISTNPANTGAAFYDNCGAFIQLRDCLASGFKYGAILDQSELADIDLCQFDFQTSGGAGVYIVNGPQLTPGNQSTFSNRISVKRCQFNAGSDVYGVLDEGGYVHSFVDNNYNGCLNHIYAAGVLALKIHGGEFEATAGDASIVLHYLRPDGTGVGSGFGEIANTLIVPGGLAACVSIAAGNYSLRSNALLSDGTITPVRGAGNALVTLSGNATRSASGETVDNFNGILFDDRIEAPVQTNFSLGSVDLNSRYAGKHICGTKLTPQTLVIKSDANVPLPIGTTFRAHQIRANGTIIFAPDPGVTINGPLSTRGQGQRLIARKRAANLWDTELVVQDPLNAAITPASITASGLVTTSAGGIGYATGAGGSIYQSTSKFTAVRLDKLSGQITLAADTLAASTCVSFKLTNSQIATGDLLILNHVSGGTLGAYHLNAHGAIDGSAIIDVANISANALSEAIVVGFAVIKAVTA